MSYRSGNKNARNLYRVHPDGEEHIGCMFTEAAGLTVVAALNRTAPRPHDGELGDARVWSRRRGGDTSQTVSRRGRDGAGSVTVAGVDLTADDAQAYAEDILAAVADARFRFSGYQRERGEAASR